MDDDFNMMEDWDMMDDSIVGAIDYWLKRLERFKNKAADLVVDILPRRVVEAAYMRIEAEICERCYREHEQDLFCGRWQKFFDIETINKAKDWWVN